MTSPPLEYSSVPQMLHSLGTSRVELPITDLWRQFTGLFAADAFQLCVHGRPLKDFDSVLEQFRLFADSFSLAEWFSEAAIADHWDGTFAGVEKVAAQARDLSKDVGDWRDEGIGERETARVAAAEIKTRIHACLASVRRTIGMAAERAVFAECVQRLAAQKNLLEERLSTWTRLDFEQLAVLADQLVAAALPKAKFFRALTRKFPQLRCGRWLSTRARRVIDRGFCRIAEARQERRRQMIKDGMLTAFYQLLGRDGEPGLLQEFQQAIEGTHAMMQTVRGIFREWSRPRLSNAPHVIHLIDDINTVLDSQTQHTLKREFLARCKRADCTPRGLAKRILERGLRVDGQWLRMPDVLQLNPESAARAMQQATVEYLGASRGNAPLNIVEPTSALEHCLQLTPTHPVFRQLLQNIVPRAAERARPYLLFEDLSNVRTVAPALLFCHPSQRLALRELFQTHLDFADAENSAAYALRHPYEFCILHALLNGPPGASPQLKTWMAFSNEARRRNLVRPILDHRRYLEWRLLSDRVSNQDDCESLFAAAIQANVVIRVGQPAENFALSRPDARLDRMFCQAEVRAQYQPPEFFRQLVQQQPDAFAAAVLACFPEMTDVRQMLRALSHESDCDAVVNRLVTAGVVQRQHHQCRFAGLPTAIRADFPAGLLEVSYGPLVGLSADEFRCQLLRNHLLNSVVTFGVLDALQLGQLNENNIPPSVIALHRSLR